MQTIILIIHVVVALGLIALVLLQQGKGAETGAAFGSGASSTVFGAQGSASFLTRATAGLATAFFLTSLTLAYFTGQQDVKSSVTDVTTEQPQQPAQPAVPSGGDVPSLPGGSEPPAKP